MPKEPTYEDLDWLVHNNVYHCISHLVATLAKAAHGAIASPDHRNPYLNENISGVMYLADQAAELAAPILDYEEAARQAGWTVNAIGKWVHPDHKDYATTQARYACEDHDIEPYEWEVYEHWVVSNWLADKLAARGEKVDKDFAGLKVWARTTTGQSIACDPVIADIWRDLHKDD